MNVYRSIAGLYGPGLPKKTQFYFLTIGTGPTVVVPTDPTFATSSMAAGALYRSSLTFHNPGTAVIYFAPAIDHNNSPVIPALNLGFQLDPDSTWTIDAPGPVAWNAVAVSSNPMTILEFLS